MTSGLHTRASCEIDPFCHFPKYASGAPIKNFRISFSREFKYIDARDAAERQQRDDEGAMLRAKKGIVPDTKGDAHFWMPWKKAD